MTTILDSTTRKKIALAAEQKTDYSKANNGSKLTRTEDSAASRNKQKKTLKKKRTGIRNSELIVIQWLNEKKVKLRQRL